MVPVSSGLGKRTNRSWCWICKGCGWHDPGKHELQAEYIDGSTQCTSEYCMGGEKAKLTKVSACDSCKHTMVAVGWGL